MHKRRHVMLLKILSPKLFFAFIIIAVSINQKVFGQADGRKNTIKVNLTNPLIFGDRALIFGYERVIGKNQSFCINAGRMSLRDFGKGPVSDSLKLENNSNEKGFSISGEYRFYLKKENKFEAPRGVYIGPYYAYNTMGRTNSWNLNTSDFQGTVSTDLTLNVHTAGVELGYQFILWKRLSIDMVLIGPGIGFYKGEAKITSQLPPDQEELFYQKLNDFLGDKIPGYDYIITGDGIGKNGNFNTTTLGFRYVLYLGFRF
jgi:hypothetical protein